VTVRRVDRYTVTARPGRVFLIDEATDADCDLFPEQAISLGEALLLAAREATKFTRDEPICLCAGGGRRANDDTLGGNE
jgi:hypothetical protein